ncbi:MAG: Enoyl-CoA hydratase/isomerase [Acidimicrobiales bacterium]|nr:Enoyl-CoA hydratase/isomerase [Acidimicrobiales bacterium]
MSLVRLAVDGGVAVVTLGDPDHRNALSLELVRDLADALALAEADDTVGAIVIAADPPVFSAGGSLDDLLHPRAPLEDMLRGVEAIAAATVPTVAAVGGPAIGAGVNVALACDVIVCSPSARFDPRFLDVGLHPGGGILWALRERVSRQAAAALVLCGDVLDGESAERHGLAWQCVPDDDLLAAAMKLARRAAGRPRHLVRQTKATLDAAASVFDRRSAVQLELEPQRASMQDPAFLERLQSLRAARASADA